MANVAHADLTDPNLHEPIGVAAANAGEIYVADGAGSGAWTKSLVRFATVLSPAIVAANTTEEHFFAVVGVVLATDRVIGVSKPTHQTGLGIVGMRVSANDQIAVVFANITGAGITPTAAETYTFTIHRST
jgi:hypothetical protein